MAKAEKKQEKQAAAEERDEILEVAGDKNGVNVASLPTPEDMGSSGGANIERSELR